MINILYQETSFLVVELTATQQYHANPKDVIS